jgi:NarL family two-component system response regulator LiaR
MLMSERKALSKQEEKVLASLAEGNLYKEIATAMGISINTVKKHLKNIYRKLDVSNRKHAAVTHRNLQEGISTQDDAARETAKQEQMQET